MKGRQQPTEKYEGVFVALLPQKGSGLIELLRDASSQFLGEREKRLWSIELGPLKGPTANAVFRLRHPTEPFPWRDSGYMDLARRVSRLAGGRVFGVVYEQPTRAGDRAGWAEAVCYDSGERADHFEAKGTDAASELFAWVGEALAMSENEVLALFESCDQVVGLEEGSERFEDEVDQALERARREYQRYQELKRAREKGEG